MLQLVGRSLEKLGSWLAQSQSDEKASGGVPDAQAHQGELRASEHSTCCDTHKTSSSVGVSEKPSENSSEIHLGKPGEAPQKESFSEPISSFAPSLNSLRMIKNGPAMRVIFFYPGEEGTYVDHANVTLYENGIVHIASHQEETTTHLQNCEILWRFETDAEDRANKVRLLKPKISEKSEKVDKLEKSDRAERQDKNLKSERRIDSVDDNPDQTLS